MLQLYYMQPTLFDLSLSLLNRHSILVSFFQYLDNTVTSENAEKGVLPLVHSVDEDFQEEVSLEESKNYSKGLTRLCVSIEHLGEQTVTIASLEKDQKKKDLALQHSKKSLLEHCQAQSREMETGS
jgi:hypothetical protein